MYCRRQQDLVTRSVKREFGTIRACLLACLSLGVLVCALVPAPVLAASPSPACGHANLDNPGHHYGLIKNGCLQTPSPPTPAPTPHPAPAPAPNPVSGGVPVTVHPVARVIPHTGTISQVVPADATPAPLIVTNPPLPIQSANPNVSYNDRNSWVVIGLLGAGFLLLLLIAIAISGYLRRRQQTANAPAH